MGKSKIIMDKKSFVNIMVLFMFVIFSNFSFAQDKPEVIVGNGHSPLFSISAITTDGYSIATVWEENNKDASSFYCYIALWNIKSGKLKNDILIDCGDSGRLNKGLYFVKK